MSEVIELGSGNWIITGVQSVDGRLGLAIYPSKNHGLAIDSAADGHFEKWPEPTIAIYVKDLAAARLLADQANAVAMRLNGYQVRNVPEGQSNDQN